MVTEAKFSMIPAYTPSMFSFAVIVIIKELCSSLHSNSIHPPAQTTSQCGYNPGTYQWKANRFLGIVGRFPAPE
jgi:hypothetical protein